MAKTTFDEEICDLVLFKAPETFEDKVNLTNKQEEAKTVKVCHSLCSVVSTHEVQNRQVDFTSPQEPLQMLVVLVANKPTTKQFQQQQLQQKSPFPQILGSGSMFVVNTSINLLFE